MANRPSIYTDSCSLIDAVKFDVGALPPDRASDGWYLKQLLKAHAAGDIVIYTSILSVAECVGIEAGQTRVPADIQDRFKRLLTSGQFMRLVTPTPRTPTIAQDLRWKHELVLGGADALHIAAALEMNCAEFITTDERLKKPKLQAALAKLGAVGLRLIKASDTKVLPDSYLQASLLEGKNEKGN